MQHRDYIAITKMIEEMDIGIKLLGDTIMKVFLADELLKRALGMTCINVGELAKVITDDMRTKYRDFPWKELSGMRDITAHRYQTLKMEDVYITVHNEYPDLSVRLKEILESDSISND